MKNHAQRLFQRSFHRPGFPMLVLTATAMCLFAPPAFNQTVEPLTPPAASTVANLPAVPKLIKFSGIALDGRGYPITVPVEATFALYAQQGAESSAAIWHETQRISPNEKGAYTAYLGATQGLPAEVFTSVAAQYLGVSVDGEPEQARTLLVSVPYALESGDAQTLGGRPASAYALANGSKEGAASANVSSISTADKRKVSSNPAVTGKGTGGTVPLWDATSDIGNSAIYQQNGNVGIGTPVPSSPLDVFGQITAQNAVLVGNSITKGVRLRDTGAGVDLESFGVPLFVNWLTNNPTYFGAPAYFNTAIGVGTAVPQAQVNLNNQNLANADSLLIGNNTTKGLQLRDTGTGVDLESIGVPLYVNYLTQQPMFINPNGGVVNIGITAPPSFLQCGHNYARPCVQLPALLNVGALSDGLGGFTSAYFSNDVTIIGNLQTAGSKNFRIDHPLDPTNKYLIHAAIESSEVLNQYSGNLVLDDKGEGLVEFPKWFAVINEDFRYQLTAIGAPGPNLHIATEMEAGGFTIAGGHRG